MAVGQKTVKWLMVLFNLIFWLTGIGLIIVGAVVQTHYKPYMSFLANSNYVSAPVLVIVIGAVITIIAFFGCCGSASESFCMLMTFSVLLSAIFVVEMGGGIAGYIERGRVAEYLESNMLRSIGEYKNGTDKVWDSMQATQKCCGVRNFADWKMSNYTNGDVPTSCCISQNSTTCERDIAVLQKLCVDATTCPIYTQGCFEMIRGGLEHNVGVVGGVAIGVALVQLVGIIFSCFLARRLKKGYVYA